MCCTRRRCVGKYRRRIKRRRTNRNTTTSCEGVLWEGRLLRDAAVETRDVDVGHWAVRVIRNGRLEVDAMRRRCRVLVRHIGCSVVRTGGKETMRMGRLLKLRLRTVKATANTRSGVGRGVPLVWTPWKVVVGMRLLRSQMAKGRIGGWLGEGVAVGRSKGSSRSTGSNRCSRALRLRRRVLNFGSVLSSGCDFDEVVVIVALEVHLTKKRALRRTGWLWR